MIRLIETLPNGEGYLYSWIRGQFEAYGNTMSFLRFYGDENGNLISIMDDVSTVLWGDKNREELLLFLDSQDISVVRTDTEIATMLSERKWGKQQFCAIMKAAKAPTFRGGLTAVTPRELYPFLKENFAQMPPFEGWYLDVSHRMRHGCCRVSAVVENGVLLSSAMTLSEWQGGAVIGAVATRENARKQGFASRCVSLLTSQLLGENKDVYICPLGDDARLLYEKLGFTICGKTAVVERI